MLSVAGGTASGGRGATATAVAPLSSGRSPILEVDMFRRLTTAGVTLLALTLTGTWAHAQAEAGSVDAAIEQLRKDTRAEVTDIIAGTMEFTSDEAAKFWPLYKKYEEQRKAVGDEKVALIKDYAANYQTMTDAKAKELLDRLVSVEDKGTAAKRQFVQELEKVLPPKTVARYYQVDNRIELLANLTLASEIPLVK
jgi:hypothetical protein